MRGDRWASVRLVSAAATVVAVSVTLVVVRGPVIERPNVAVVLLLWGVPVVGYWLFVRTALASVLVGAALALGQPLAARAVILTDSSTAPIGFLAFGVLWWVGVAAAILLSRMVTIRRS